MAAPVGFQPVLDAMGRAVVHGELAGGDVVRLEEVEQRYRVSRAVAREAVRILETLGLVAMKRRVGCIVRPRTDWIVSDPRVVRWRLEGPDQAVELTHLMQLRRGIEPTAARLSALASSPQDAARLVELADVMAELGGRGEGAGPEFLAADVEFHRIVLTSSHNDHFAAFSSLIATLLTERNQLGLLDTHPDPRAMDRHRAIAAAIAARNPDAAEVAARELIDVVGAEVQPRGEVRPPGDAAATGTVVA